MLGVNPSVGELLIRGRIWGKLPEEPDLVESKAEGGVHRWPPVEGVVFGVKSPLSVLEVAGGRKPPARRS